MANLTLKEENEIMLNFIKDMVEGEPFKVGDIVKHPDGRMVKIISGQYWGTYGISNFWYWKEVFSSGKMGIEEYGYGW